MGLFALTIATGSAFIYFNKDVIIHEIQQQLQKSGAELDMEDINVTFFSSFPNACVNLTEVQLSSSAQTPLLTASKLSFNLDLMKLIDRQIQVKKVQLRDGHLKLLRDDEGGVNYKFASKQQADETDKTIRLDVVELIHMDFTFHDEKQHHLIRLKDVNTVVNPTFENQKVAANIELSALGELLTLGEVPYFFNQQLSLKGHLLLDNQNLIFTKSTLKIGDSHLAFGGSINNINSNHPELDIKLSNTKGRIEKLTDFLPDIWLQSLTPYEISGDYSAKGALKGKLGGQQTPHIYIQANLDNTQLIHEAVSNKITEGQGDLNFSYGGNTSGQVSIKNFHASYEGEPINFDLELNSFDSPEIKSTINGQFDLKNINSEIIPSIFIHDAGRVLLTDFLITSSPNTTNYQGVIKAFDLAGVLSGVGFTISEGQFHVSDHIIDIEPTNIEVLAESHTISGRLDLEKEIYGIDLISDNINLKSFFDALEVDSKPSANKVNNTFTTSPRIRLNVTANKVGYENIEFNKTVAKINWKQPKIHIKSKMEYCEGQVVGKGSYNTTSGASTFVSETKDVDLKQLFTEWNNFDQEQIQAKHLKGKGDIQCMGSFVFNPEKPWDSKSMDLVGGLHVENGELHNVPVFKQFSNYVHIKDLSHIKFNTLSNVFKISKGRFYLPEMFIQSNAANIIVAGHQTLDNEINYALKVNAGQILTNKIKKHDPKLKPVKAKKKGFFNLHYIIKGPIDNFEYFANKRRVNDKLEQSLFIRDEIIQRLNNSFDITDRYISPHLFQDIPEMEMGSEGEVEFLEGFD